MITFTCDIVNIWIKEVLKNQAGDISLEDVDKTPIKMLRTLKQDGRTLEYADKKLQADKEVVLAAVKQDGFALEYADKKLQADKEVVLAALKDSTAMHGK